MVAARPHTPINTPASINPPVSIEVVGGNRFRLRLGSTEQSTVDLDDPSYFEFEYVRHIAAAAGALLAPGPITAVHCGGGALTIPRYLAASRPGSRQQVIELDREVIDVVRRELPLPRGAAIKVRCGDGAAAATILPAGMHGKVDLIVVDVFAASPDPDVGAWVPAAFSAPEFIDTLDLLADPDAIVCVNIGDGQGRAPLQYLRRYLATLATHFPEQVVIADPAVLKSRRFGNLVVVAGRRPLNTNALARAVAGGPFPATVAGGPQLRGTSKPFTVGEDSPLPPAGLFR